ncbi:penicillin acylase family protein [Pseudomonas chlororaphis]|uniref:penicillin acylase family protein n=1 Tax=Pseudomonas chlororaphis TaxID=587753 RepID=UPI000F589E35|nr:penicillin acylase family protein [Pseudomonas chlororaphis]AZC53874.1 Penicillin G acylase precursor [Pseudomonas chlororaphis subsp. piscium]AZC60202.1 Penicillin G acylase precursor [Pseudomonas chlororaphis subsp. piscium]AZC78824.1 Penicillin G acylase precursor [Pseudomonas chlororaphis subsp. piscium]AZC85155.1 Penicillin G acylase precursor [Pseudomonas chlororaphis subsp. piscium]MBP5055035.1 penicillin acylase family protein [Pseudomonas chlororaphis]
MKRSLTVLAVLILALAAGGGWYLYSKQPSRQGQVELERLQGSVTVRYDERGVPHIRAENETDLYRALGYVHAQDRLFQMEVMRRLARGELAEILGPKLLDTDKLFRSLRIRERADSYVAGLDRQSPAWKGLQAYLDGVNQYQNSHPRPIEFDVLGIPKRSFTAEDSISVAGYMAYSFAAAFRTEPLLTYVRDQLGSDYLKVFDLDWQPKGALAKGRGPLAPSLAASDWQDLGTIARLSEQALADAGLPQFEGSNAWAVSGTRTKSGKPLLAGDPHIRFAVPSVWYEAQLSAPGFELYGHHQALVPFAFLGHNLDFGWSLTMFQNDDLDLVAEKVNPNNANQVWYRGKWVDLVNSEQQIAVKGQPPVTQILRQSPHGPIINDVLGANAGKTPIAMWWAFLETPNPILDGFYQLNRADTLAKARSAASKVQAPGLNIVWANAKGDIGWWAAALLPKRPIGAKGTFILDGSTSLADKEGFYPFSANPQEENPARGYIVSANFQPVSPTGMEIPGYYNLADRGQQLDRQLSDKSLKWDIEASQKLQLGTTTAYGPRLLAPLLPVLREVVNDPQELKLVEQLAQWKGDYPLDSTSATLFNQFLFDLTDAAFHDELGDAFFDTLLSTRVIDAALPRLAASADSPWWDNRNTLGQESRADTVRVAWRASLAHLKATFGDDSSKWLWGQAHTLTHGHPLGLQKPLDRVFNVGPFAAPGTHEVPNNQSAKIGPAPWPVTYGPSTRRLIDFADPAHSLTVNPVGQSGVLFDKHYQDQAEAYIEGVYQQAHFNEEEVTANTHSTLKLLPARTAQ